MWRTVDDPSGHWSGMYADVNMNGLCRRWHSDAGKRDAESDDVQQAMHERPPFPVRRVASDMPRRHVVPLAPVDDEDGDLSFAEASTTGDSWCHLHGSRSNVCHWCRSARDGSRGVQFVVCTGTASRRSSFT